MSYNLCLISHPFISARDTGRGLDRYACELEVGLKLRGIRPQIIHTGHHRTLIQAAIKEPLLPIKLLAVKADVYHAVCPAGAKTAIMLGNRPIVTTIHDMIPYNRSQYEYSWLYAYHRFCIKLSALKSDKLIVPFHCLKKELVDRFGIREEKIKVMPYGIDHDMFRPMPGIKQKSRSLRKVLYIGSITKAKGVDTLIHSFSILQKELGDVELILGGKEVGGRKRQDQEYIKQLPSRYGIADRVKFIGFVPEERLPSFYNDADVVVFPSNYGFGLPVLEAMACGTPTVAAAALDGPEGYGGASILVEPGNVRELANVITRILIDTDLRERQVNQGIKWAKTFSWEKMIREVVDVYDSLCS